MKKSKILRFPRTKSIEKINRIKNIDKIKYFTEKQIKLLRRTVRDKATLGNLTNIREWTIIDTLTSSGIRVGECANLRCGDLKAGYGESAIFVRNGKGGRSRTVQIPESTKLHLKKFIIWKEQRGELAGIDDFLFIGQRGPMTSQAIEQIVKKYLKKLGIYESGKSVHSLRHSYAVQYYRNTKDLIGLKQQLGHANLQTTNIYAQAVKEDIQDNIKGLWGGI